jgi:hypothetical protein
MPKLRFPALLLLTFFFPRDAHVPTRAPTEIVIIGTVHVPTAKYGVADLVGILQRLKPGVVLFEYPPELMTENFEFKTIDAMSLEQRAVLAYAKESKARVRPYDIAGRNAFFADTDFFGRQAACNTELNAAARGGGLAAAARRLFDELQEANAARDAIGASDARAINSFDADTALNRKQWLMNDGIPEIVRLTPALSHCEAFWNLSRAYWIRRNNAMLQNIRRFSEQFAGERLVVLAGFEHRYYLRSHFYDGEAVPSPVLREYWDIN